MWQHWQKTLFATQNLLKHISPQLELPINKSPKGRPLCSPPQCGAPSLGSPSLHLHFHSRVTAPTLKALPGRAGKAYSSSLDPSTKYQKGFQRKPPTP